MKIRRFAARSYREALAAVHAGLSPQAVVLAARALPDGTGVELTAALDYDLALAAQGGAAPVEGPAARLSTATTDADSTGAIPMAIAFAASLFGTVEGEAPTTAADPAATANLALAEELAALRREVAELKRCIAAAPAAPAAAAVPTLADLWTLPALDADLVPEPQPAHLAALYGLFAQMGFDEALAHAVLADLPPSLAPERLEALALRGLAVRLPVLPDALPGLPATAAGAAPVTDLVGLCGPAGAGTRSAVAKLAARALAEHGKGAVAVVRLRVSRATATPAADGALPTGVPLHSAHDWDSLQAALAACAGHRRVVVEAAGAGAEARALLARLALTAPLRCFLVLPAPLRRVPAQRLLADYRALPLAGVVLGHLDAARELGPVLSVLAEHALGIAAVSTGSRAPQHLHAVTAADLLDRALALSCRVPAPITTAAVAAAASLAPAAAPVRDGTEDRRHAAV